MSKNLKEKIAFFILGSVVTLLLIYIL